MHNEGVKWSSSLGMSMFLIVYTFFTCNENVLIKMLTHNLRYVIANLSSYFIVKEYANKIKHDQRAMKMQLIINAIM